MCKNYQDADLCRATTKLYVTFLVLLGVRLSGEWKWNGMALWILVSNPLKIISWKFETNPSIFNFWPPTNPDLIFCYFYIVHPLKIVSWKFEPNPSIFKFWSPSAPTHPYLRFFIIFMFCALYRSFPENLNPIRAFSNFDHPVHPSTHI